MSIKNLYSEILRGTWLIDSPDPENYRKLANAILSGNFLNEAKPELYSVMAEKRPNATGGTDVINQVAVIDMVGEMTKYSAMCNYGADFYTKEILKAQNDPDIKGIILRMDGPGGNANAMPLFQAIKPKITKPVVSLVARACSLHYWVAAMFSSHIMLEDDLTAEVGSIGALVTFSKPTNEVIIIRPPESKDKAQDVIDALNGDTSGVEAKLSPLAQAFQKDIQKYRPEVKEIYGKTFTGQQAIKEKMADSIGDLDKAYQLVLAKSEINNRKTKQ